MYKRILIILAVLLFSAFNTSVRACVDCQKKLTTHIVFDLELIEHSENALVVWTIADLYKDNSIHKPNSYLYPLPDLLAIPDEPTIMEQKPFVMHLKQRMRAFQGAFHSNTDYAM